MNGTIAVQRYIGLVQKILVFSRRCANCLFPCYNRLWIAVGLTVNVHILTGLRTRIFWLYNPLGRNVNGDGHSESFAARIICGNASVIARVLGRNVLNHEYGRIFVEATNYFIPAKGIYNVR